MVKSEQEIREKCKKNKCWEVFYPDGTSSLMTYDPIRREKEIAKKYSDKLSKIRELHKLVVNGLVNGLSHTHQDGRKEDIVFWRKRCNLFDSFSHCVLDIITDQCYEYSEKDLKEISKEGYNGDD